MYQFHVPKQSSTTTAAATFYLTTLIACWFKDLLRFVKIGRPRFAKMDRAPYA